MALNGNLVELNGARYYVRDSGTGSHSVVLLHGWPDDGTLWQYQIAALLKAGYRVICPDLLSYGQSDTPENAARYSYPVLASDIVSLLNALELQQVHLIAHDFGAVIGWEMASAHADRLKTYVAFSVGHLASVLNMSIDDLRYHWYFFLSLHPVAPQLYRAHDGHLLRELLRTHPNRDEIVERALQPNILERMWKIEHANPLPSILLAALSGQLPEPLPATIPAFGIWSTQDDFLLEPQVKNSGAFVNAEWRYERIEGAGHWFMLEQPEKTNQLLLDWLSKHP